MTTTRTRTAKRFTVLAGTVALAGTLLSPSAFAASGTPYTGTTVGGGGGDYGKGNCGYNNGGTTKFGGPGSGTTGGKGLGGWAGRTCPPLDEPTEKSEDLATAPAVDVTPEPEPVAPEPLPGEVGQTIDAAA